MSFVGRDNNVAPVSTSASVTDTLRAASADISLHSTAQRSFRLSILASVKTRPKVAVSIDRTPWSSVRGHGQHIMRGQRMERKCGQCSGSWEIRRLTSTDQPARRRALTDIDFRHGQVTVVVLGVDLQLKRFHHMAHADMNDSFFFEPDESCLVKDLFFVGDDEEGVPLETPDILDRNVQNSLLALFQDIRIDLQVDSSRVATQVGRIADKVEEVVDGKLLLRSIGMQRDGALSAFENIGFWPGQKLIGIPLPLGHLPAPNIGRIDDGKVPPGFALTDQLLDM